MSSFSDFDEKMMLRALELAEQGRVTAPPNPWVGCVIVKDQKIIGEGFTLPAGQAHAEVNALRSLKESSKGATAYVTLEPCSHYGRTPPCSLALIEAQVAKVVVGLLDPDPRVSGRGLMQLRAAGIEVITGVAEKPIEQSLRPYLHQRRTGRPYCVGKAAVSIDGRIAAQDGTSKWISSREALMDTQQLRAESQAILVGSATAPMDNPSLTVREVPIFPAIPPLRIVLDAKGSVLPPGPLFDKSLAPTLFFTTEVCSKEVQALWKDHGIEVAVVDKGLKDQGVNLHQVLELLGKKGILQLMIEGGGTVLGAFLQENLLQRLRLYIGPRILGSQGLPLFAHDSIKTITEAPCLKFIESKVFGTTIRIDYGVE